MADPDSRALLRSSREVSVARSGRSLGRLAVDDVMPLPNCRMRFLRRRLGQELKQKDHGMVGGNGQAGRAMWGMC